MSTTAVIFEEPGRIALSPVDMLAPGEDDVVVEVDWSGISTGTERLLFNGEMPEFPGMGYPLVPGYEAVGRIVAKGGAVARDLGETVFVPGSRGFRDTRHLFGASASRLMVPAARAHAVEADWHGDAALMALAATAHHALAACSSGTPDLVVGHGVLGRLIARLAIACGGPPPTVWETNAVRRSGACGYDVVDPADDDRRDYPTIVDVSGATDVLDTLIARLAPGGTVVLAGFYKDRLDFAFAPAFMREATIRAAAEWRAEDLAAVTAMAGTGALSLAGLVTDTQPASAAAVAYRTAFNDPECLKMLIDWRQTR